MGVDRYGNQHAPNLPYARGRILAGTEDDFAKLQAAGSLIRGRGPDAVHIFTGLEHGLPLAAGDLAFADDEIAAALYFERVRELALDHLGGMPGRDDVAVFNRLTGATIATHLTLVRPGDVVIGVSASHSHPSVVRAAEQARALFIDTAGLAAFRDAIASETRVALVVLTRLAVTYDLLAIEAIEAIVGLAHDKGALIYVDDAGGARVGPAAFGQPKTLELGADVGATGLDKYGTRGPRLGLLAGRSDLVARIRAKGFEFGMEARQMLFPAVAHTLQEYDPARVRALIAATREIGRELRPLIGNRLRETPTTVQIAADDILEIAIERGGVAAPPCVPYEASAALAMLLLRDYGMLMVHFVGMPPGTADLLIKFVPPERLERFGGAKKYAAAINTSLSRLGELLRDPEGLRALLLHEAQQGRTRLPRAGPGDEPHEIKSR